MTNNECILEVLVVVEKDGEGFHAFAPALKGLHVDGETQGQAMDRAKDAIKVYCDSLIKHNEPIPEGPGLIVREAVTPLQQLVILPWTHRSGINSRTEQSAI